ncbi:MAG: xanthine phosphoribosyltransferase [Prevotella sp.]|nr:xanthine phosphoribosyltransferase [Prevotella sp.]
MALKVLCDRILSDGCSLEGAILKVDRFINHQMDPYLMKQIAVEFIRRFSDVQPNKILTVEASGIAPAVMLGYMMELPVVFAKKKHPSTMNDAYVALSHSFAKDSDCEFMVSREYLTADDRILFVDDFLAYGNAGKAIIDLCQQAGATIEGMGFIIEEEMLGGRKRLEDEGIKRIESLAIIDSLENNEIHIKKD